MARRVLLGNDGSGNIVFRISKPGKDIMSTNLNDFLLNEQQYNTLPVVKGIVSSLPYSYYVPPVNPGGIGSQPAKYVCQLAVYHGLGFIPMFIADPWVTVSSDNSNVEITVDDNYVYLTGLSSGAYAVSLDPAFSYAIFAIPVG